MTKDNGYGWTQERANQLHYTMMLMMLMTGGGVLLAARCHPKLEAVSRNIGIVFAVLGACGYIVTIRALVILDGKGVDVGNSKQSASAPLAVFEQNVNMSDATFEFEAGNPMSPSAPR